MALTIDRSGKFLVVASFFAAVAAGCGGSIQPAPQAGPIAVSEAPALPSIDVYRSSGFLTAEGALPFVGLLRFAATATADSTDLLVALSIPPRALSFVRAGDRYAAYYGVKVEVLAGGVVVRTERPVGEVRVASFPETIRGDEGVLFQKTIRLLPGAYTVRITAQDSLGPGVGSVTKDIDLPRLVDGTTIPMIPVFTAEPRLRRSDPLGVVVDPRATARYGRDPALQFYLESYGSGATDSVVVITARVDGPEIRRDTAGSSGGGPVRPVILSVPIARLGFGAFRVTALTTRGDTLDATTAVVSLGADLPVRTSDELIAALKYFASEADMRPLRSASVDNRPAQWAALVKKTDPNPATPDNEALGEYFRRLRVADALYHEGQTPGWATDRGAVLAGLGEPDVMTPPQPADSVGPARVLTWEYRRHRLLLVFGDAAGFGQWKLTPASDADFRSILAQSGPCVGCR